MQRKRRVGDKPVLFPLDVCWFIQTESGDQLEPQSLIMIHSATPGRAEMFSHCRVRTLARMIKRFIFFMLIHQFTISSLISQLITNEIQGLDQI